MTKLDLLRDEMKQRGCNKQMIESKTTAVVLDILSNSGDKYTKIQETEDSFELEEQMIKREKAQLEKRERALKDDRNNLALEWEKIREVKETFNKDVDNFNKMLSECEAADGRDALRAAQLFVNSVNIDTKYDNTAFIIGLAAIMSQGKISAIGELKKINKKLPMSTDEIFKDYCSRKRKEVESIFNKDNNTHDYFSWDYD